MLRSGQATIQTVADVNPKARPAALPLAAQGYERNPP